MLLCDSDHFAEQLRTLAFTPSPDSRKTSAPEDTWEKTSSRDILLFTCCLSQSITYQVQTIEPEIIAHPCSPRRRPRNLPSSFLAPRAADAKPTCRNDPALIRKGCCSVERKDQIQDTRIDTVADLLRQKHLATREAETPPGSTICK